MVSLISSSIVFLVIYFSCCSLAVAMVDSTSIYDALVCMLVIFELVLLVISVIQIWCKLFRIVVCLCTTNLHALSRGVKLVTNCLLFPTRYSLSLNVEPVSQR